MFLREHLFCALCQSLATEVHHKRGRIGQRLLDFEACMPLCFACHRFIHDNPRWARQMGYLV
jgi:hypothetical protein